MSELSMFFKLFGCMHACILNVLSVRLTREAIEKVLAVSTNMSSRHSCEKVDLSNNFSNLKDLFTFAQTCFLCLHSDFKKMQSNFN